jgi:hypothetical protein
MTIENQSTIDTTAQDTAIKIAADNLIRAAAVKNGMTLEQVPQEAREDAYRFAKAAYEEDQALKSNPVYASLQAEREAHKLTRLQLEAVKQTRPTLGTNAQPSSLNPEVVRAQMGEGEWRALTDNGRLQACGINPTTVTPVEIQECKKIFGRGMDSHYSSNAFKQDSARYRHLKNIAIVLGIQGQ